MVELPFGEGLSVAQDGGPVLTEASLSRISLSVLLHAVLCLSTVVYQELFLGIGEGRGEERSLFPPFVCFRVSLITHSGL